MISLFRRIRQKLIGDWNVRRYLLYAIGEILLVVIGILIALQVNNWNEHRKSLDKERYYLNSIKASIELSQDELNRVIHDAESIVNSADTLFIILSYELQDQYEPLFIDSLLFNVRDYSLISLNDGGIQEILNTGSMDIIQDEEIRVILASWNERIHQIRKFEDETLYSSRRYSEYISKYFDISRYLIYDDSVSGIIPEKREDFLTDPVLVNHLSEIWNNNMVMGDIYKQEKADLDSLNTLIDEYLQD
ncbi:DUF6090 family protein [Rhodohalobacter mucosus]|uniref:Uncharacterized protein n=1 Tax=Rhodohalobacter mucosus TaxID=2079485 RepID=A0A316TM66_9BACT|nr:DUF6090 family protein [Rhodohalobacter mucosus]PWN05490.1 hypothetical protein DDZ15_12845 [Rhodohalobacter mucosus]